MTDSAGTRLLASNLRRIVAAWGPALVWMLVIFVFSSIPDVPGQRGLPRASNRVLDDTLRQVAHVVEYAILAGLLWRAARRSAARCPCLWAAVGSLVYAASDEFHQSFVPGRKAHLQDWLTDLVGVALGLAVTFAWHRLRREPRCHAAVGRR